MKMASKSARGFETLKESLKRKQNKAVRKTICNVKLTRTKTGLKNMPWGVWTTLSFWHSSDKVKAEYSIQVVYWLWAAEPWKQFLSFQRAMFCTRTQTLELQRNKSFRCLSQTGLTAVWIPIRGCITEGRENTGCSVLLAPQVHFHFMLPLCCRLEEKLFMTDYRYLKKLKEGERERCTNTMNKPISWASLYVGIFGSSITLLQWSINNNYIPQRLVSGIFCWLLCSSLMLVLEPGVEEQFRFHTEVKVCHTLLQ